MRNACYFFIDSRTTSGFSHEWEQIDWNSNSRFDYNNSSKGLVHLCITHASFDSTMIEQHTLEIVRKYIQNFFHIPLTSDQSIWFTVSTSAEVLHFFCCWLLTMLLCMRSFHLLTTRALCMWIFSKRITVITIIMMIVCSLNAHTHTIQIDLIICL